MNRVEVIEEGPDGLARVRWSFWVDHRYGELHVYVDLWADEQRASRRHKWRAAASWARTGRRYGSVDRHPPLPDHVREQARAQIVESITFVESKS